MKAPKPRDYGLNSDHAPFPAHSMITFGVDPDQPFTQDELHAALTRIVEREALGERQRAYRRALDEYHYNNGGR